MAMSYGCLAVYASFYTGASNRASTVFTIQVTGRQPPTTSDVGQKGTPAREAHVLN